VRRGWACNVAPSPAPGNPSSPAPPLPLAPAIPCGADVCAAVKLMPVLFAPLTVTLWLDGVKVYPLLLGVTV
jgi:hypothetical protein